MRTRKLYEGGGLRTFVLVLDKGDEAFAEISAFARAERVTGAGLTAVGGCREVTLGYFDPEITGYRSTSFAEQMEVLSLVGDIATQDDEPALHAHLVLGRKDSSAIGGHLERAVVFPTLEVVLTETPAHLRKRVDQGTGLALIAPDASSGPA
ncbi:PPC domain-containing DNA-binding protein [Streptomyces avicenniae]|uniref:PPC domain-containing DNA-binding protein n=1 Tax=Streptomyces avicenniae TaxID=500153 RepID=UPI00069BE6C2|nr:PPC domain-containing DNA-binding protein [Streptomyces avicenniae]